MSEKLRVDILLYNMGLAESRSKAQDMIDEGIVLYQQKNQWMKVTKANQTFAGDTQFKIFDGESTKFVSRGGLKLQFALETSALNVQDQVCLDIGQSTGGFTDCLLQAGALKVVGLDVGHDQLHFKLREDQRVVYFEKLNIREYKDHAEFLAVMPPKGFMRVVADLSFISLHTVLSEISDLTCSGGELLLLVKPQFEVGSRFLNRKGIVKDQSAVDDAAMKLKEECQKVSIDVLKFFACKIEGRDGNQEYFIYGKKN